MRVRLRELKPNPVRDFGVDPLDEETIGRLRASIREHGFWGGVVGRQRNGHIEIGAGHHRVEAAIREGVEEGEIHLLPEIDDRTMTRLYAEENATQRGAAHSTARAGSVAAALRLAAYHVLTGRLSQICDNLPAASVSATQGNIASAKGIGARLIYEHYLYGVPGITRATITGDLASLKASGEYARILADVRDRIEQERREADEAAEASRAAAEREAQEAQRRDKEREAHEREKEARRAKEAAERAEKAASRAASEDTTFDFRGVAAILKVAHHLQSFRTLVTSDYVREHLPVDQQAAVAERIVALAEETGQELTGLFIRTNLVGVVSQLKAHDRQLAAEERERLLKADWHERFRDLQSFYLGALRNVILYGEKLLKHREAGEEGEARAISSAYRATVAKAKEIIDTVEEGL